MCCIWLLAMIRCSHQCACIVPGIEFRSSTINDNLIHLFDALYFVSGWLSFVAIPTVSSSLSFFVVDVEHRVLTRLRSCRHVTTSEWKFGKSRPKILEIWDDLYALCPKFPFGIIFLPTSNWYECCRVCSFLFAVLSSISSLQQDRNYVMTH